MICVSIEEETPEKCLEAFKGIDFAEIRLDRMPISREDIKRIFSQHSRLVATCRPGSMDKKRRRELLLAAIESGARFVDIEVEADDDYKTSILAKARSKGCQMIISYHNFFKTPEQKELEKIIDGCFESGADIAKIACLVNSDRDNARLLGLLQEKRPLVVIGMGERGKISRIVAPFLGSLFTYASLGTGKETAPGQMDYKKLKEIVHILKNV